MEDNSNFMMPTASRAYHSIESIIGVSIKPIYEQIEALEDVVLFLTNHDSTLFFDKNRIVIWDSNSKVISDLLEKHNI